jgi:hypothetical protein
VRIYFVLILGLGCTCISAAHAANLGSASITAFPKSPAIVVPGTSVPSSLSRPMARPLPAVAVPSELPSFLNVAPLVFRGEELPNTFATPKLSYIGIAIPDTFATPKLSYTGMAIPDHFNTPGLRYTGQRAPALVPKL